MRNWYSCTSDWRCACNFLCNFALRAGQPSHRIAAAHVAMCGLKCIYY